MSTEEMASVNRLHIVQLSNSQKKLFLFSLIDPGNFNAKSQFRLDSCKFSPRFGHSGSESELASSRVFLAHFCTVTTVTKTDTDILSWFLVLSALCVFVFFLFYLFFFVLLNRYWGIIPDNKHF